MSTAHAREHDYKPEWPEPEPLVVTADPPAEYPLQALPSTLLDAAQEVARFVKVPVASPAVVGLSVAATAAGKRIKIEERTGLCHRPALFHVIIAATGERKSQVYKHMTAPLEEWSTQREPDWEKEVRAVVASNDVAAKVINSLERQVKKDISEDARDQLIRRIITEKERVHKPPSSPRLFTTNATEEMLFRLMHERGGAFAVMSGEGRTVIDLIIGKYSGAGRTGDAIYLAGISGDTISRDRIGNELTGEEAKIIRDPMLNVCIMVQPDKYMEAARHPRLRDSGALARIWSVLLQSRIGTRIEEANEPGLNNQKLAPFRIVIHQILDQKPPLVDGVRLDDHLICLGADATRARREWHNIVERMMGDGDEFEDVRDIACKAVSTTVKAAAVLHVLIHPECLGTVQSEISLQTWKRAQLLGEYHLGEAIRVQRMAGQDQQMHDAQRVLEWLAKKWVGEKGFRTFKSRDLQLYSRRPRPNSGEADRICASLEEHGYVRKLPSRGGELSPAYAIHPDVVRVANVANVARGEAEK